MRNLILSLFCLVCFMLTVAVIFFEGFVFTYPVLCAVFFILAWIAVTSMLLYLLTDQSRRRHDQEA